MTTLRARYVLPVDAPPIENGAVTIRHGLISSVKSAGTPNSYVDLGDVVLLPALVNAHTHLEFSSLQQPLGHQGVPFADWIRMVVQWRRNQEDGAAQATAGVLRGLQECEEAGALTVGEIVTAPDTVELFRTAGIGGVAFYERIGLARERLPEHLELSEEFLDAWADGPCRPGISPHAPYTISLRALEGLVGLSKHRRAPLAMHLAETREELELLRSHAGPLVELLSDWGVWAPGEIPLQTRPLDYLKRLASAHRALLVHGNYLEDDEIQWIADHARQVSVVYCPRTHAFFQHDPYQLPALLRAGVNVAVGTDSRASNPNLCVLDELKLVASQYPELDPALVLRLATINGAVALGWEKVRGSLAVGKQADMITVGMPGSDPYEALFSAEAKVIHVYREGRRVERREA